jgi:hypothetical protein
MENVVVPGIKVGYTSKEKKHLVLKGKTIEDIFCMFLINWWNP